MRHYLLTWYGITDIRAALGFEKNDGPVLGALKTGEYTDVVILAYTDPAKVGVDLDKSQKKWQDRLAVPERGKDLTRQDEFEAVDAFSNTPLAHRRYKEWLRTKLREVELTINVRMAIKALQALNDAKGIYAAATDALELVSGESGDKQVTFYLSPGTPVMAFTWAFVSLVNPELSIRVISSSDPRKPPVPVALPYDLLAPSNRKLRTFSAAERDDFDIVFHLFGEQRMPSFLGIRQFRSQRHVFVTSDQYSSEMMKQFIPKEAWSELRVNPFDPMSTKLGILKEVSGLPSGTRVGFNLTGGTKLMFAGAIAACRKISGVPFYFETKDHKLIFLHDFSSMEMRGIDNIDAVFRLNGFVPLNGGKWEENACRQQRRNLTKRLWKDRAVLGKLYRKISEYTDFEGDKFVPFSLQEKVYAKGNEIEIEIDLNKEGKAYLRCDQAEFSFRYCPDFAKYLAGKWLEEYTYHLLEPLFLAGTIRDLRIGLEVNWESASPGLDTFPVQEFDIAFTDGKRLFVVECKAGGVFSDDVYKLQHCIRNYGGVDACGIMACAFPPHHPQTRKRLESASKIASFYGWDVTNDLANYVANVSTTRA